MEASGLLSGGAPLVKKYTIGATISNAGIIVTDGAAGGTGVIASTTANAADAVGLALDTATYTTTQGDVVATISVVVNPDLILKARLSGGATSGTALTAYAITSDASDGLSVITTEFDVASPSLDEGTVWGADSTNFGAARNITAVASNDATVVVPFKAIVTGDKFYYTNVAPHRTILAQLTSDFTEINSTDVTSTDAELACFDLDLNGAGDSFGFFIMNDHLYGNAI